MSNILKGKFDYPLWGLAKLKLKQKILEAKDNAERSLAIDEWFANHVIEMGLEQTVTKELLENHRGDLADLIEHGATTRLADQLFQDKLYAAEELDDPFGHGVRLFRFRILLFGASYHPMVKTRAAP